ncbi:major facilitator transporter [Actinotalea ferrariae CF5-4]|uniref:Major facilitator transporter n=1 Tax=Actinotalea ferrariae CF5-4 TaxID=948458 RepID=A0A021VZ24_9CELL|nr:major facilitator transporter [Actinotalea ferrariae CF5-4]
MTPGATSAERADGGAGCRVDETADDGAAGQVDEPTKQPADDDSSTSLGRRFHHLLGATALSNLSDGILQVGIPLLALTLTSSPLQLSLVAAAAGLPWLLLGLHVGVLVDRYDRARLLGLATATRVLVLVAATVGAATGALGLPLLVALVLAFGIAEVVADSAAGALVPAVVRTAQLHAANSRLMGAQQLANAFLGGPAAGVLVALGAGWLFGVPAALCTATLLLVVRGLLDRGERPIGSGPRSGTGAALSGPASSGRAPSGPEPARSTVRSEIREGLQFLLRHRVVRPLLLGATVLNFASAGYFAVFPLWVVGPDSAVGLRAELFGLLTAALAVGAIAGAVLSDRLGRRLREMPVVRVCWAAQAGLLAVPVLVPRVEALVVTALLLGLTNMVGNVVTRSMRQRMIPGHLLGRVGGAASVLGYGSMPLGALIGGVVGEALGLPAVLLGAAVLSFAAAARVAVVVPQSRVVEADAAAQGATA